MLRFLEKRKVLFVYTPLILYWLILLTATSTPSTALPTAGIQDKILHFIAYFGLGILINLTLMFQNKYDILKKKSSLFTIVFGSIYAALDEIHQYFIPGRFMEFLDFVADLLGLVLAVILILFLKIVTKYVPEQ